MSNPRNYYDVIIVGARCAGATLGALLASRGVRTLILDASPLPSDMPMTTHYMQPPGMDVLDELGVGDSARALALPMRQTAMIADQHRLVTPYPEGRAGYCIRRVSLDTLLQNAAIAAGAELLDRHRVVELIHDGERVSGVVVQTPSGQCQLRAGLVIGADGRNSKIAQLTGVEEYLRYNPTRGTYWSYWPVPDAWKAADCYPQETSIAFEGRGLRCIFPMDHNRMLLVAAPPLEEAERWGRNYRTRYVEYLKASPTTAPLLEGSDPAGKVMGLLKSQYLYRRAVGPGFALVGDAGHVKDPIVGQGMSEALIGAKHLAAVILDGRPQAFEWYWRHRDATTAPLFFESIRLGTVGVNDALFRLIIERCAKSPQLQQRLGMIGDRRVAPQRACSIPQVSRWLLGALCRGQFQVLPAYLKIARQMLGYEREIAVRQQLLEQTLQSLGAMPQLKPSTRSQTGVRPVEQTQAQSLTASH